MIVAVRYCTLVLAVWLISGCQPQCPANQYGQTFYLDGAGNWGYGAREVPAGLRSAGYQGGVEVFIWTTSLNPLVDQVNIIGAKTRAAALAGKIQRYHDQFPDARVNLIALSAGTGVATWAIEDLPPDVKVDNLILLGSSLSHDYDMRKALSRMTGKIYAYFSPQDAVLEAVRVFGTIDRKQGVDSIGLVGLKPPAGLEDRVVNIGWNRRWMKLGWTGAHTDTTNERFVRYEISKRILSADARQDPATSITDAGQPSSGSDEVRTSRASSDGVESPQPRHIAGK